MGLRSAIANQNNYEVNTFLSCGDANYSVAIKYYQQKAEFMKQALLNKAMGDLKAEQKDSIETLFEQGYQSAFNRAWEQLYNSKQVNYEVLQKAVQNANVIIEKENEQTTKKVNFLQFINDIGHNAGFQEDLFEGSELPEFLDITDIERVWDKLKTGQNTSIPNIMGEIFEQAILGVMQDALDGLEDILISQTGSKRMAGKKVKPDALISVDNFTITDASYLNAKKTRKIKNNKIAMGENSYSFDLTERIDLSDVNEGNLDSILSQFPKGLVGLSAKQWTEQAGFKSIAKYTIRGDWGPFTQDEIKRFKQSTLRPYIFWNLSRHLINILGALNVFMASGTQVETTNIFLQNLRANNKGIIMAKSAEILKGSGSLSIGGDGRSRYAEA